MSVSKVIGLEERSDHPHLMSHVSGQHPVLLLETVGGVEGVACEAQPHQLTWQAPNGGVIRLTFEDTSTLRIVGRSLGLRFDAVGYRSTLPVGPHAYLDPRAGSWVLTTPKDGKRYLFQSLRGDLRPIGDGRTSWSIETPPEGDWELRIHQYDAVPELTSLFSSFDDAVAQCRDSFIAFLDGVAPWRSSELPAVPLAAYVVWASTVSPRGYLSREAILMSKHWMDRVWSWDHCFNAMAVASADPQLALDQFLLPYDHQIDGALPDSVCDHSLLYNFVKPPVHGWAFRRIRSSLARPLRKDELALAYSVMADQARYWLEDRVIEPGEVPYYTHGNDAQDNSTVFDRGAVVRAPDLVAYLAIHLDVLAEVGTELGREEASFWRDARASLVARGLAELSDDLGFFARSVEDGSPSKRTALQLVLPLLAAEHFPDSLRDAAVATVHKHLTDWGVSTEQLDSEDYDPDGYWRGPIWAPVTLIMIDGLRAADEVELARDIARRFVDLCTRSGFAENFDARTGQARRDTAYTWTASVYLVLARELTEATW